MTLYNIDEDTQIDEFGVDHSNFSLRDKLEYNFMRAKEKDRTQCFMPNNNGFRQRQLTGMPKTNWNDVIMAGITGTGEGMLAGVERFANGITGGGYGKIVDSNFDNAYTKHQQKLQDRADNVGLGNVNRVANAGIDVSGRLMPYAFGLRKILK